MAAAVKRDGSIACYGCNETAVHGPSCVFVGLVLDDQTWRAFHARRRERGAQR